MYIIRVGLFAPGGDGVQVLIKFSPLGLDHFARAGLAGREAEHELDKELVALMLAPDALREPIGERGTAGRGDGVDALLRPTALFHRIFFHQPALFQPGRGSVYLGGLYVPVLLAAYHSLKGGVQLVTMSRTLG